MPYMMEGKCVYKKNADGSKGESMGCSETEEMAKKHMAALYANENKSLAEFSMVITKASIPDKKSRAMRLSMVSSDTSEDAYEERMSTELFHDFVERIDKNSTVPEPFATAINDGDWNGGMPYLSISHYKSGSGVNVPGKPERVYVDGEKLKSTAILDDTPLGQAVWKSVCQDMEDREKPLEERMYENPVRVSIGFLDLEHKHVLDDGEEFVFTRTDLNQKCEKCEDGINGKTYLKGQLVHLAFTRVPANPRTSVEVMKMAGEEIKTKKDDAKSIVGELAEELVGKSTVTDDVLVIKAKAEKDLESYAWDVRSAFYNEFVPPQPSMWVRSVTDKSVVVWEDEKMYRVGYTDKDGQFSFDERSKWEEVMVGLIPVKSEAVEEEWNIEFKSETSEEVMDKPKEEPQVQEPVAQTPVAAPQKSALDLAVENLKSKVTELRGKGTVALEEIQPLFNELGNVVKSEVYNPAEAVAEVTRTTVREEVAAALQQAVPEIVAQIVKSLPAAQVAQPQAPAVPQARSLLIQRNAIPQAGQEQMSQIKKLAYNSTVGYATGQRVE